MSEGHLIETFEDGIATLTMNRPESLNALSAEMMGGLREAVPRLAADEDVRVVILTGAGRAFCAGGDVKGMAKRNEGLLPTRSPARNASAPPTAHFSSVIHRIYGGYVHIRPLLFNSVSDLLLRRARIHFKRILVLRLCLDRRLFGQHRGLNDI